MEKARNFLKYFSRLHSICSRSHAGPVTELAENLGAASPLSRLFPCGGSRFSASRGCGVASARIRGSAGILSKKFLVIYAHCRGNVRTKVMSDYSSIAAFDDEHSARALALRMNEEGFEAIASSDSTEQLLMFFNPHPRAQHHVFVPGQKLEPALQWLQRLDAKDPVLLWAVRCPDCRSTRIEYPQFSRKTIVGSLPAIGAALGLVERQFYCTACHFTWGPEDARLKPAPSE